MDAGFEHTMLDAAVSEQVFRPRAQGRWTTPKSFASSAAPCARSCSGSAGVAIAGTGSAARPARSRRGLRRSGELARGTGSRWRASSITVIASVTVVVEPATKATFAWRITLLVFLPRWHACARRQIRRRRFPARSRSTAQDPMSDRRTMPMCFPQWPPARRHPPSSSGTPRSADSVRDAVSPSRAGLAGPARDFAMIGPAVVATPAPTRDRGAR